MRDWSEEFYPTFIPEARVAVISKSQSAEEHKAAAYFVQVHRDASWELLGRWVYEYEEEETIKAFKAQLPKPKGNQCDCAECVGAVCSDSVHSAL